MKSPISAPGASPSVAPPTRSFNVLLADGSRLRVTCRDLAAQLRQERTAALRRLRQARAEALADIADRIGEARIRREFEAAERDMNAAIRRLSKQVRVKPERRGSSPSGRASRSRPMSTGHSGVTITRRTTSALARRDRLGREGMMLRIRYVRAGGRHASPGCLRRHYRYIAREAAVTLDSDGAPIVLGNMGGTDEEVVAVLNLQEQVLRAMRKNAKLGFRMVGAFPYGLSVDARRAVLQRIGDEVFGARGLPWTAAAHDADPGASVDNPHFHFDYGQLPMELQADGSVVVSNDLRTDLDGQEGLRFIRHSVARVMTEVAREFGLDREFTALSYRERGMDREGGEHVGQEGTAAHRRGEHVALIARNEAKQRLAKARDRARRARDRLDVLKRLKRAILATPATPELASVPAGIREADAVTLPHAPAIAEQVGVPGAIETMPVTCMAAIDVGATLPIPLVAPNVGDDPPIGAPVPEAAPYTCTLVPDIARALPLVVAAVMPPQPIIDAGAAVPTTLAVPTFANLILPAPTPGPVPVIGAVLPGAPSLDRPPSLVLQGASTVAHRDAALLEAPPSIHDADVQSAPIIPLAPSLILPPVAPLTTQPAIDAVTDIPSPALTVALTPMVDTTAAAPEAIAVPPAAIDLEASAPPVAAMEPVVLISDADAGAIMMPMVPKLAIRPASAPAMALVPVSATMPAPAPSVHDDPIGVVVIITTAGPAAIASVPAPAMIAIAPELPTAVPATVTIGSKGPSTAVASIFELPQNPAPRISVTDFPSPAATPVLPVVDVPAAVTIPVIAPVIATPPTVRQIGRFIRAPRVVERGIWRIGKAASGDADERETEQRIKELLDREEASHRDANTRATAQRDLEAAFKALRRHDEWMRQDEDGLYTVSNIALRASGLSRADIVMPTVQAELKAIGMEQVSRLGPALDAAGGRKPLFSKDGTPRLASERRMRENAEAVAEAKTVAAVTDVDAAVLARRRQIADACRILRQSVRRPYRIIDNRAFLDLDVMGRRERSALAAVGLEEREVTNALLARIRRDRADDERARTEGMAAAQSPDRIAVLARIADRAEAATAEWVASRRVVDAAPSTTIEPGNEPVSPRVNPAITAAIAARLFDQQRGG